MVMVVVMVVVMVLCPVVCEVMRGIMSRHVCLYGMWYVMCEVWCRMWGVMCGCAKPWALFSPKPQACRWASSRWNSWTTGWCVNESRKIHDFGAGSLPIAMWYAICGGVWCVGCDIWGGASLVETFVSVCDAESTWMMIWCEFYDVCVCAPPAHAQHFSELTAFVCHCLACNFAFVIHAPLHKCLHVVGLQDEGGQSSCWNGLISQTYLHHAARFQLLNQLCILHLVSVLLTVEFGSRTSTAWPSSFYFACYRLSILRICLVLRVWRASCHATKKK